jgi:hypothetical protein
MSERSSGWSRKFDEPIALPDGRRLVTLHDAATYITALPDEESSAAEWQTAIEVLMLVSRSGPTMMVMERIGVMRALNRHVEWVFKPDRKKLSRPGRNPLRQHPLSVVDPTEALTQPIVISRAFIEGSGRPDILAIGEGLKSPLTRKAGHAGKEMAHVAR